MEGIIKPNIVEYKAVKQTIIPTLVQMDTLDSVKNSLSFEGRKKFVISKGGTASRQF
jgi:hypothetical protein